MKKKLLSILLSLAMVVTMMPAMTMTAFAANRGEGTGMGEDNAWDISAEGEGNEVYAWLTENTPATDQETYTLIISGTGRMMSDFPDTPPWYADYGEKITSAEVRYGVTNLGEGLFYGCDELKNVEIPNSITAIGSGAFSGCGVGSITIPEGVTIIDDCVFENCSNLTSITIPEGVTSIGAEAFHGCEKLPSVTIPSSVTDIGDSAFYSCNELISMTIKATNPPTLGESGPFDNDGSTICVPAESVNAYKKEWEKYLPKGVVISGAYTVNVAQTENGTVSVDKDWFPVDSFSTDKTVTITTTPDDGYELDTLTVKTVSDNDVSVENNQFTMPAGSVTVSATFKAKPVPTPAPTSQEKFNASKTTAKAECDALLRADDSDAVKKLVADAKTAIDNVKYDSTKSLEENNATIANIVAELKQNVMEQRADEELTRLAKATKGNVSKIKAVKGKNKLTYKVADKGLYVAKYQIYRSTKKSSGFKKLATTSKKTYTDTKNLKKGKKYYYKVRGMVKLSTGKYTYTKYSSVKSVKAK